MTTTAQKGIEMSAIRKWWKLIELGEKNHKPIDTYAFADFAHQAIPVLLNEISRLNKEKTK